MIRPCRRRGDLRRAAGTSHFQNEIERRPTTAASLYRNCKESRDVPCVGDARSTPAGRRRRGRHGQDLVERVVVGDADDGRRRRRLGLVGDGVRAGRRAAVLAVLSTAA